MSCGICPWGHALRVQSDGRGDRQVDREAGAVAGEAVAADLAAEALGDEVVDDVEAEAAAAAVAAGGEEGLEDPRQVLGDDPGAVVGGVQDQALALAAGRQRDAAGVAAVEAVDDGVEDEVGDDLRERAGVG
jgi:hypothetical protein